MARLKANGLEIEYEVHGDPKNQPLLLIMGLGAQLITWDEGFVDELVKRGFFVIRYDNRDSGLSSRMESAGPADIAAAYAGNAQPAYNNYSPPMYYDGMYQPVTSYGPAYSPTYTNGFVPAASMTFSSPRGRTSLAAILPCSMSRLVTRSRPWLGSMTRPDVMSVRGIRHSPFRASPVPTPPALPDRAHPPSDPGFPCPRACALPQASRSRHRSIRGAEADRIGRAPGRIHVAALRGRGAVVCATGTHGPGAELPRGGGCAAAVGQTWRNRLDDTQSQGPEVARGHGRKVVGIVCGTKDGDRICVLCGWKLAARVRGCV